MRFRGYVLGLLFVLCAALSPQAQSTNDLSDRRSILRDLARLPLGFEQNVGQADTSAKFIAHLAGYSVYFSRAELLLVFDRGNKNKENAEIVRISIAGAAQGVEPQGFDVLPGVANFYVGADPARWRTGVRRFRDVRYHDIYPGVDLVFYGNQQELEFDFDVLPGSRVSELSLKVAGATLRKIAGSLELQTPGGSIVKLQKPNLYQVRGKQRQHVSGVYVLDGNNEVFFSVGRYDRSLPLVIDPALVFSTFTQIGNPSGSSSDVPFAITVDGNGAVYVTGQTVTGNPDGSNGTFSAFVLKLDSSGSSMVFLTHLGGTLGQANFSSLETVAAGLGVAVDASGNAYITGLTKEVDFPTTTGTFSTVSFCASGGTPLGCLEPFAAKLDLNGKLVFSTFLVQASALDNAGPVPSSIAVDANGALYVTGTLAQQSTGITGVLSVAGLTTTSGAFQTSRKDNSSGFVLKLHPDGSALDYSTYLGGSTAETPGGIAVDSGGVAYVDGGTSSADFPTTPGAFQTTNTGMSAFFSQLKADGSGLLYSTFLGASGIQSKAMAIALDNAKSAYLTGVTSGPGFPTTLGAFKTTAPTPQSPVLTSNFVSKFNSIGTLSYSTYVGDGVLADSTVALLFQGATLPSAISVDGTGAAYISGVTASSGFPSVGSIQSAATNSQNAELTFVTKLNPSGSALDYATFFGPIEGPGTNSLFAGMALDSNQNVYLAGVAGDVLDPSTNKDLIPGIGTTLGVFQPLPTGQIQQRMFVAKIAPSLGAAVPVPSPRQVSFSPILQVGSTSLPRTVQINNYGDAALIVAGIAIAAGPDASDFAILSTNNTCGAAVPVGGRCSFLITFTPSVAAGTRTAAVNLSFGGGLASQRVALMGQAGSPVFQASPSPLDFGNAVVGNSLMCSLNTCVRTSLTLTNTGTGPLDFLAAPSLVGANLGDFFGAGSAGGQGSIPTPPTLQPGQGFALGLEFIPTVAGTRTAQLVFQTDASGSPQTVQLTGNGIQQGNGGFSIGAASGASMSNTISAGQTANYSLVVVPSGLNGSINVTMSCTGAPQGASCNANPSSFTLNANGSSQNVGVKVPTTSRTSASLHRTYAEFSWLLAFTIGIGLVYPRRRRSCESLIWIGVLLFSGTLLSCGGGGYGGAPPTPGVGTPAGTYTLTVTATSASTGATNSQQLKLIVQ